MKSIIDRISLSNVYFHQHQRFFFFKQIRKLQIEIHEKNRTLDEYRMRQEQEVLQLTQKHQMELMKKLQSAKEEQVHFYCIFLVGI